MPEANIASLQLTIDGTDMADKINPRFLSLSLTEKRCGEADELNNTLHNTDGKLAIPEPCKVITLALGWRSGAGVPVGFVDKGRFTVDDVECSGPQDQVQITARSTDLNGAYRKRRTQV